MPKHPLDDRSVNRLLNGEVTAEDAPPGYARVAALLSAARPVPATTELPLEAAMVSVMQSAISTEAPLASTSTRRKKMLGKVLSAKAAALAGVVMLTATGAAAATGSLPGAAQQVASDALAKVGISVPGPNSHAGEHPDSRGSSAVHTSNGKSDDTTHTTGPNAHAQFGQCTAQAASAGHPNDNSAVSGATDCTNVTHPGNPSDDHGQSTGDHGASGDHTSTPAGPPTSTPASDHAHAGTPNKGSSGDDHGKTTDSTANDAGSSGTGTTGDHGRP
jgi:hypothetical protein